MQTKMAGDLLEHVSEESTRSPDLAVARYSFNTANDLILLKQVPCMKPGKDAVHILSHFPQYLPGGVWAVDLETTGVRVHAGDAIQGVGISNGKQTLYWDWPSISQDTRNKVFEFLCRTDVKLIAHNAYFDFGFLFQEFGVHIPIWACTYGAYKQLATEGYPGQSWSLKSAQLDLLGWDSTNEQELDEWLVNQEHISDTKLDPKEGYVWREDMQRWCKPKKGEMYKAPKHILGYYCGLDCYSTVKLFELIQNQIQNQPWYQEFTEYHKMFLVNIQLLIEQQIHGITLDVDRLQKHAVKLGEMIEDAGQRFLNHEQVLPFIQEFNQLQVNKLLEKEPAKHKKLPKLGKEPAMTQKDGELSSTWERWNEKRERIEALGLGEITKSWENWDKKVQVARESNFWNLASGHHRRWLFYEKLGFPVILKTETGEPAVDKKAMQGFGEPGALLKKSSDYEKELSYVTSYIEHAVDGRVHPQFRVPGTLTGRLSGSGGFNVQQLPKSKGLLECFRPLPGNVWIDYDINSLEQVVLAELSQDPTLLKLYGPDAKQGNDVYLFNGSHLPIIGDKIRAAGYDPDSFTPESVEKAKKECKKERNISKVVSLACIAEDTLILTERGMVPIQNVTNKDSVWDGEAWVSCDGVVDKGFRRVHNMKQVYMTADHKVLGDDNVWRTQEEWTMEKGNNASQPKRPIIPSLSWSEIWRLGSSVLRSHLAGMVQICISKLQTFK